MQGDFAAMEPPSAFASASSDLNNTSSAHSNGLPPRPRTATMRHTRNSSRMADAGSKYSDDDVAKTAVKVAVRIRPPLKPTDPGFDLIPHRFRESTCAVPTSSSLSIEQSNHDKKLFLFDRVFDENTTQEGVWDYVSDSVSSFVQGYNVSILAYGQSGAGKSYTMGTSGSGDQNDPNISGIIPRAAHALFDKLNGTTTKPTSLQTPKRYSTQALPTLASITNGMNSTPKNWELRASYLEIYNEQLRDLLLPESAQPQDRSQVAIREDKQGRILFTGLTTVPINSAEDLMNALNHGSTIRQTDATAINARSSRSHAVFSLNLRQRRTDAAPFRSTNKAEKRMSMPESHAGVESLVTFDSKLHFVDLAGSERLKNTGATGDRAKEGININAGLASLGKVISQLSSKQGQGHISYRDSKLTRLLQDSLGGSAITFMVACITPAKFHLSETLNTVHYAQRARAIQIRPQIQHLNEEGDKQATIDRLRAEVNFLRGQADAVRDTEKPERAATLRGKERELQSEILDMQESYNALSQRHARLIAEISKSRDSETGVDTPLLNEAIGENASERIKRSNSFAEAVEQVVLEYEKTIQSLETSLSQTRSNLASTESTLMEKESRIAYMDSIKQQLESRVAKYMEREANNDSYTRSLEGKMEGASTEEERRETLISELRNELARVRESEVGAEDYISTLEERLAEAEQDQELMQREIDRLEHVVERQRSIGRLDNLLGELDGVRTFQPKTNGVTPHSPAKVNGHSHSDSYDPFRAPSSASSHYEEDEHEEPEEREVAAAEDGRSALAVQSIQSPAQTDFVAEKLESLTQEFFDLRSEHENVLTGYDSLQQKHENLEQKYKKALETLAKLETLEFEKNKVAPKKPDTPDESVRGSFLADARMKEEGKDEEKAMEGQPSSSQSLSEELSSQSLQNTSAEATETEAKNEDTEVEGESDAPAATAGSPVPVDHEEMLQEMETLRKLHAEKQVSVTELTKNYMSLASRHEATLAQVQELKQEVARSQSMRPASPSLSTSPSFAKGSWRRKSEELLTTNSDRASRSFVSMKALVMNNLEEQADVKRDFEQHLSTVMSELHVRSERVTALEAEISTVKKEMENKQTIITGLTRERSSLAAASHSGVDFNIIGQLRDQLVESENQIRTLHEEHAAREMELQREVDSLKMTLADHQKAISQRPNSLPTPAEDSSYSHIPGDFPVTPVIEIAEPSHATAGAARSAPGEEMTRLQNEVTAWENKHREAMDTMTDSQAELLNTISDLQGSLRLAERGGLSTPTDSPMIERRVLDQEREKHNEIIEGLTSQVLEHKQIADDRVARLDVLQEAYTKLLKNQEEMDDHAASRGLSENELQDHRDLVSNLESQLQVHKSAITIHQESLESLQASHTKEIDDLQQSMSKLEEEHSARYNALQDKHERVTKEMSEELLAARNDSTSLLRNASSALGYETDASKLQTQISGLVEEGKELHGRHLKTTNELKAVQEELQNAINRSVEMDNQIDELKTLAEQKETRLEKMTEKYNKSAALVDQLEEQLNSNFDSHQETNKRLSSFQSETVHARIELERELEEHKARSNYLAQQLEQYKHMSVTSSTNRESLSPEAAASALGRSSSASSNTRSKSGGAVLPTPPPSIPLPPLPASPMAMDRSGSPAETNTPPGSRHASDVGPSPAVSQLIEEQEARIRTIEKHLFAEKQLTATLEEALVDLETSANRTKSEMDNWRKKCQGLEDELVSLRKQRSDSRASLQAVEEEREMRLRAERARQALEQRMNELNAGKKKKKSNLNCF